MKAKEWSYWLQSLLDKLMTYWSNDLEITPEKKRSFSCQYFVFPIRHFTKDFFHESFCAANLTKTNLISSTRKVVLHTWAGMKSRSIYTCLFQNKKVISSSLMKTLHNDKRFSTIHKEKTLLYYQILCIITTITILPFHRPGQIFF